MMIYFYFPNFFLVVYIELLIPTMKENNFNHSYPLFLGRVQVVIYLLMKETGNRDYFSKIAPPRKKS